MYICNRIVSVLVALCVFAQWTQAALTPDEIANSLNELAQQGFAAKNLVLVINSTSEAGPIPDVYTEMDTMITVVLTNVNFMTNTPVITDQAQEQSVYEGYSNSLLELMDAFSASAAQLMCLDKKTKEKVPSESRILQSAIDAYFYNIIGLFPANSSYNFQANNQKAQVDTHFFQAVWAFDVDEVGNRTSCPSSNNSTLHARRMVRWVT